MSKFVVSVHYLIEADSEAEAEEKYKADEWEELGFTLESISESSAAYLFREKDQ